MYILIAILAFGILIATHELGHFLAAKSLGVKVNEFAIGMGPTILKKQGKETKYSLRLLPVGGFCAMEGEDESSEDPRAFSSQKAWRRFIILVAGAFSNFLIGFLVVVIIYSSAAGFAGNKVEATVDGFLYGGESGILPGDTIYSIDGHRIYYSSDFSTYMSRSSGGSVDMVVIRDGEKVRLKDYSLQPEEYIEDGETVTRYGLNFEFRDGTLWEKLKYSGYTSWNFVRMVWMGLSDLVTGAVGLKDMSGPVGIVSAINDVGHASGSTSAAAANIAYLCAFIAVNLAVMNMLPIPALDGGRVFFLLVTWVVEKVFHRKPNPKVEGAIHAIGLILLLALMAVVMFFDIWRLTHR